MFNESFYLQMNPDVAIAVAAGLMSAQEHFELYGKFENRAPSPFFDPVLYLRANPDVAEAVQGGLVNAFDHFMSFGQNEARSPSVFFDPSVYLRNNPDVAAAIEAGAFSSPFEHFLLYGQNEIRNTAPFFDLKGYLDANPDVAAAVRAGHTTAFDHFINHGFAEDRDLGNGISLEQFASDPKALAAIQNGDYNALMSRVAEVAPFLPTYSPPAGYTVPSNTPLPTDFVPVGEEKLVVPPGVKAPDDLPPNFQQPEPEPEPEPEPGEGGGGGGGGGTPTPEPEPEPEPVADIFHNAALSSVAQKSTGGMLNGSGNSAEHFEIVRIDLDGGDYDLELALGAQERGADVVAPEGGKVKFAHGNGSNGKDGVPTFKFSVASLGDKSLADILTEYEIRLRINTDHTDGTKFIELEAIPDTTGGGALDWVFLDPDDVEWVDAASKYPKLIDDAGTSHVSQNIQALGWYQPQNVNELFVQYASAEGEYTVLLGVYDGETLIGQTSLVFDIGPTLG